MTNKQIAEKIADKLMFICGVNVMGTLLSPSKPITPTHEQPYNEIKGGSYCRDEVVQRNRIRPECLSA